MRMLRIVAILCAAVLACATPVGAQTPTARTLQLSFDADGRVNLAARNVTVREILAEWARQCGCRVVNAERLPGGPLALPLQFEHASQAAVLRSLLQPAAGYVLTPGRSTRNGPSRYDTIYILATSTPVAGAYVPTASTAVPTVPISTPGAPEDEIPPVVPAPPPQPNPTPQPGPRPAAPTPNLPGTSGTFVPIVPIGPGDTPQSSAPAPGSVTPAPGTNGPGMAAPSGPGGGR